MNAVIVSLVTMLGTIIIGIFTFVTARHANKVAEAEAEAERDVASRTTTLREMEVALSFTATQNDALRKRVTELDGRIQTLETEQERCRQETHRLRRQIYMMGGHWEDDDSIR